MKKLLLLILLGICLFTNICFAENKEQNTTNSNIATSSYVERIITDEKDSVYKGSIKISTYTNKIIKIGDNEYYKYKVEPIKIIANEEHTIYFENNGKYIGKIMDFWKDCKYIIWSTNIDINDIKFD